MQLAISLVLFGTVVALVYLQELTTVGAAWLLGYRDPRLRILRDVSLRRAFTPVGWLLLPGSLGTLLALGVPIPQWGYSRPLLSQQPQTPAERRDWRLIQLAPIAVFLAIAAVLLLPYSLLPPTWMGARAELVLGTIVKQTVFFALLQLIPVPPFAMGRAFPAPWTDLRTRRTVQSVLLGVVLLDAFAGWGIAGWTFGLLNDLLLAFVRLLS